MHIRDRIVEFCRVPARQLRPNPKNWRLHPPQQQDALRGVLAEIGYADALLARRLGDGSLELIDGHLRAETTPDMDVPVLVIELSDAEADKLLAVLDPLAALAQADEARRRRLADAIETDSAALRAVIDGLLAAPVPGGPPLDAPPGREPDIPEVFQVVAECDNETQQQALYQRLTGEGYHCRLLTL